jgi:UDP-N-acetylglucosamine enolpyruvyl transferase
VDITTDSTGIPTDVQAQMMVLMLVPAHQRDHERIFESRFTHVPELCCLGRRSARGFDAIARGGHLLSGPAMA